MTVKSPLKNGLFVRRPLSNALLLLLNYITRKRKPSPIPPVPQKILLCNTGSLGDVFISTTVLPAIKAHYPNCKIGFLTSSKSKVIIQDHTLLSNVHFLDHWYVQKNLGLCKAALHYLRQKRQLLKELKEENYEVAIDLYPYFPNAVPLLERIQIPVRIAYPTGGFSNLLTHVGEWDFADKYFGHSCLHLLTILDINTQRQRPLSAINLQDKEGEYIVIHMGSSDLLKEWNIEKWILLTNLLKTLGLPILLTGKGERETANCSKVAQLSSAKNLSDSLNWKEFVSTVQNAKLVISVDSVTTHIAAATSTPTIILFTGINPLPMWTPPSDTCKAMIHSTPCAPCFQKRGCSSMHCIQEIDVYDIFKQASKLLSKKVLGKRTVNENPTTLRSTVKSMG